MAQYTPMIQQYLKIKAQYQDAFLFFRLGDFYEMFFEDALKASQELEITLTSRDGGAKERIPMCGVPHHSADNYISQLVQKGYKVAICEQVEDPKQAKGVVKRDVVQLITPGTIMKDNLIQEKENNYLAALSFDTDSQRIGVGFTDLTTGEIRLTVISGGFEEVVGELYSSGAKEIIVPVNLSDSHTKQLSERLGATLSIEEKDQVPVGLSHLSQALEDDMHFSVLGRLLSYLARTQKRTLDHLQKAEVYTTESFMKLDIHSKRNLELVETIRSKGRKGSLVWLLDKTATAMGGRMLKQWIEKPLLRKAAIENRLDMVETLTKKFFEREDLREKLTEVYDLERLAGRVAYGNVNARDLIQLKKSLEQVPHIIEAVKKLEHPYATKLATSINPCKGLVQLLTEGIQENPPLSIKDGDIIRDGFNEKLDQYRSASRNGKQWIAELEQRERQLTGIKSLKIGYNRVFGYYIEVTKANLKFLQEDRYERKQTLTNAERYITPELKEKEALILEAEDKSVQLEYELFQEIRTEVKEYIPELQKLARSISELDVLQSFAVISEERHYTKPVFKNSGEISIINGRHPVVEKVMDDQEYVANDLFMNEKRKQLLITGPNMSGKSTYMRQLALTAIMAQIGCFVPAEAAQLPIFDQVFTRIGAADDLVSGQSTFMVEMLEAKNAITKATANSLILLDEIGRGTSTYDGMALAQAIIEYIHNDIGATTLFSTHYHELTDLEHSLSHLKNVHVRAVEENGKVVFLHKVEEGSADKSYGIHVAKLAQLPEKLIHRAQEILHVFETNHSAPQAFQQKNEPVLRDADLEQLSFFAEAEQRKIPGKAEEKLSAIDKQVLQSLKEIDLLEMTPLDAINKLYELQKHLKQPVK